MAIGRTVVPRRPTRYVSRGSADIPEPLGASMGTARVAVRSVVMIALTAFAILVILPAAVAAQVAVSN